MLRSEMTQTMKRGKQSRDSTCDLDSCLDSLDNLKTVLQNAVVSIKLPVYFFLEMFYILFI